MTALAQQTVGPVFVGGTGRSGTTVVGELIGHHPRFAYIPVEMRFHAEPSGLPGLLNGKVRVDEFVRRMRSHWLLRSFKGPSGADSNRYRGLYRMVSGDQLDHALERFEEAYEDSPVAAARQLVEDLTRPTLRDLVKPSFVEMTPNNLFGVSTLLEIFPTARVVHSTRDGRDVAASLVARGVKDMETALDAWAQKLERFHLRNASIPPDRLHVVSLYDLVHERREEAYDELVDFLGVPDSRAMRTFFDTRMNGRSARIGRWRDDVSPEQERAIDDHYHRLVERLHMAGMDVAGLGQDLDRSGYDGGPGAASRVGPVPEAEGDPVAEADPALEEDPVLDAAPEPEVDGTVTTPELDDAPEVDGIEPAPQAGDEEPTIPSANGAVEVQPSEAEEGELAAEGPPGPGQPPPMPFGGSLLWVDPRQINLVYGSKDSSAAVRGGGEAVDGDWDSPRDQRFDETDIYRALEGHLVHNQPWEATPFYRRVTAALERGERKFGSSTVEEFRQRRELIDRLYAVIRNNGYRTQAELGTRRAGDEIRVAIDRRGRFLFQDGRHRLSIARILGLPRVPVRVTRRHAEWEAFRESVWAYARRRDGRVYQVIDHPDLADVPAHHGTERVDMITAALGDFATDGKRVLDIGTHWGYMGRAMEKLGLTPTGVEYNPKNARFAQRLVTACGSGMTVWTGNIFDFPEPEKFEVVLALNIFHHLVRTEESHSGLERFLGRLRSVERIFFEAHLSDGHQLRGAYRNYPSREFAEFVAEHARMNEIEHLGAAADGRELFKLSR